MILYHGTNMDFSEIDLAKSKRNKDFGQGFYLTANRFHAERIARQRSVIEGGTPVIMRFEYDEETALSEAKMLTFKSYSKEWVRFVNMNRNTKYSKNA